MSQILVEKRDGIAIVTLNRPEKRNALSPEMIVRLAQFWKEAADDHAIRVVVVTGAGDQAFSSGGDLGSLIPLMMRSRAPQGEWEERFSGRLSVTMAMPSRFSTSIWDIGCGLLWPDHG